MTPARLSAFRWTAAVLLAVAAILLVDSRSTGVGGADSAGYANTARQILERRIVVPVDGPRELGLGADWDPVFRPLAEAEGPEPGTMVPFYPPGFPLHIALAVAALGWKLGPFVVSPLLGIASLVLTYLLGRELGLARGFSLLGAVMLAGCTIFITGAVQPMSDVATLCWSTAAILCALRARSRGGAWALLSGAAFGVA